MFKSVEIYLIDEDTDKPKINTPLYIPVNMLKDIMDLPKKQFEMTVMSNIQYD